MSLQEEHSLNEDLFVEHALAVVPDQHRKLALELFQQLGNLAQYNYVALLFCAAERDRIGEVLLRFKDKLDHADPPNCLGALPEDAIIDSVFSEVLGLQRPPQ